jgi:hypothetical protein
MGPVVLLQAPAGGAAADALDQVPIPAGWQRKRVESGGVAAVVASPSLTATQLDAVAGSVAPIDQR